MEKKIWLSSPNMGGKELEHIHDIGPKVAESVCDYFQNKKNIHYLKELFKLGINVQKVKLKKQTLKNKVFVLTGSLENLTRDEAKKNLRDLGAKISATVSNQTDFVIVGENPGSKYNKAKKIGVKIINENIFLKMLD